MCNCNSSFCNICCRRVKAYRFDDVPEITGDLQLYTEFYKVGEAYGHWKFTIDDLEAYFDIPVVKWQDKQVAFGKTATGGIDHDGAFLYDYSTSALTVGTRLAGTIGIRGAAIGTSNILSGSEGFIIGSSNTLSGNNSAIFGTLNTMSSSGSVIFGGSNTIAQNNSNIFGGNNTTSGGFGYNTLLGHYLNNGGFSGVLMMSDYTGGSTATANRQFTAQFAGGYRFRLDASSTALSIAASTGIVNISNVVNNNTENQLLVWNSSTKDIEYRDVSSLPGGGGGSVTSVGMTITGSTALTVAGSPITTSGVFAVTWTGNNTEYVRGDGTLATFPSVGTGTVTSVSAGNGMTFTTITASGAVRQ